jgi:hypothetical protein
LSSGLKVSFRSRLSISHRVICCRSDKGEAKEEKKKSKKDKDGKKSKKSKKDKMEE